MFANNSHNVTNTLQTTIHNFATTYENLQKLYKIHKLYIDLLKKLHNSTKLYTTLQNSAKLYNSIHNYTQLYTTVQHSTQLYKTLHTCTAFYKIVQNYTKLPTILKTLQKLQYSTQSLQNYANLPHKFTKT